ncbi:hypothetical protein D7X94_03675 [Acutalibacter sp. 1XD8-33]|nr:hypothetical protein D7X94_03675 [Acutalibacter sp. 1XD8-33]
MKNQIGASKLVKAVVVRVGQDSAVWKSRSRPHEKAIDILTVSIERQMSDSPDAIVVAKQIIRNECPQISPNEVQIAVSPKTIAGEFFLKRQSIHRLKVAQFIGERKGDGKPHHIAEPAAKLVHAQVQQSDIAGERGDSTVRHQHKVKLRIIFAG